MFRRGLKKVRIFFVVMVAPRISSIMSIALPRTSCLSSAGEVGDEQNVKISAHSFDPKICVNSDFSHLIMISVIQSWKLFFTTDKQRRNLLQNLENDLYSDNMRFSTIETIWDSLSYTLTVITMGNFVIYRFCLNHFVNFSDLFCNSTFRHYLSLVNSFRLLSSR